MKKFLFSFLLFVLIVFAVDRLAGEFLGQLRPSDYKAFLDSKKEFFNNPQGYQILVIGDSHVADAIDTRIFRDSIGQSAFNMGIYHSSPFEYYHVLKAALEFSKKKPEFVILGTNPGMFLKKAVPGKYTPLILPPFALPELYLNSDEKVEASAFFKTVKEKYLFASLKRKITGKPYRPTREVESSYNGYLECYNSVPKTNWTNFDPSPEIEPNLKQVNYFEKCITLALENHCKIIIVNSPIWSPKLSIDSAGPHFKYKQKLIKEMSDKYNIPIFNYRYNVSEKELSQNNFLNTDHVNSYGAKKFTTELTRWFRNEYYLKENLSVK